MDSIGIIDINLLELIPPKYWKAHEFCFFLHDQIFDIIEEYKESGVRDAVEESILDAIVIAEREEEFEGTDIIEFMKKNNLKKHYRQYI